MEDFAVECVSDFDLALDSILDIFAEEPEDAALQRARKTFRKLSTNEQDRVAKKVAFQMAPKVMKNDIRRYFSRMFMNTINSGDFGKLQDYFQTFMKRPTKFVANHEHVDPSLHIPSQLIADGPRLMAHYLLGTFVMYPDMILLMNGTRITTSTSWTGTKIEMDVECFSTKMYDLSIDDWIPQLSTLGERYRKLIAEKKQHLREEQSAADATASTCSTSSAHSISSSDTIKCESISVDSFVASGEINNINDGCTASTAGPDTIGSIDDQKDSQSKRKRNEPSAISRATSSSNSNACITSDVTDGRIPEEFIHSLATHATLLPHPVQLHMSGSITMFLDENNHIQHMNMTLRQL